MPEVPPTTRAGRSRSRSPRTTLPTVVPTTLTGPRWGCGRGPARRRFVHLGDLVQGGRDVFPERDALRHAGAVVRLTGSDTRAGPPVSAWPGDVEPPRGGDTTPRRVETRCEKIGQRVERDLGRRRLRTGRPLGRRASSSTNTERHRSAYRAPEKTAFTNGESGWVAVNQLLTSMSIA